MMMVMTRSFALAYLAVAGCRVQAGTRAAETTTPSEAGGAAAVGASCVDAANRDVSDQFDQALPLALPSNTTLCNMPDSDEDMFVVTAPAGAAGSVLRYTVKVAGSWMSPAVTIYDTNRKEIAGHPGAKAAQMTGWVVVAGGTKVHLKVSSQNIGGPGDTYILGLEAIPLNEAGEPNGSWESATTVELGAPASGILGNAVNDPSLVEDWYSFIMPPTGKVTIVADIMQGVHPAVEAFDSGRRSVAHATGGNGERVTLQVKSKPGKHYVKITGATIPDPSPLSAMGDLPAFLTKPYTLTISQ